MTTTAKLTEGQKRVRATNTRRLRDITQNLSDFKSDIMKVKNSLKTKIPTNDTFYKIESIANSLGEMVMTIDDLHWHVKGLKK